MRIAICGGGLQGVELCWLARKAGWDTVLLDKSAAPPAGHLAQCFFQQDLTRLHEAPASVRRAVLDCDLLVPATENAAALSALVHWCGVNAKPLAFDARAYAVTSSKLRSRTLFARCGTPVSTPCTSPETAVFPLIAKPSGGSGSAGVGLFHTMDAFAAAFPLGFATPDWLFEAYCPGPSYSVEVCGVPGKYTAFQVTGLEMDANFDCCGVFAPSGFDPALEQAIAAEAVRLAEALQLRGLMDLEVIVEQGGTPTASPAGFRALEVDARFPSQTPTAVWLSTGVNLLEQLAACFLPHTPRPAHSPVPVWYGHVVEEDGHLRQLGEHVMATHGPLFRLADCSGNACSGDACSGDACSGNAGHTWFGADDGLCSTPQLPPPHRSWAATLMFVDGDPTARRDACLARLQRRTA